MIYLNSALKWLSNHHIIIIVGVSFVAHGLLLLNDGVYYDGWARYHYLVDKDWTHFQLWITESGGIPTTGYLHWVIGYLPSMIFSYKLVAFLSITFSAILVYLICKELRLLSRAESLFIALLSLSYPALQIHVDLIMMPYLLRYCLFLLACFMALRAEKRNGSPHYLLRVGSLALFVLSFATESFLVFYFGFLLVLILHARRERNISLKRVFTRFLPHRIDYVLLPMLYFVVDRVFFPASGFYSDFYRYNPFSFSPSRMVTVYDAFINNAVYAQLKTALGYLFNYTYTPHWPTLFLLVAAAVVALLWIRSVFRNDSIQSLGEKGKSHMVNGKGKWYAVLFFGIGLLALAIFPYAAVGKAASVHGYSTRHALLIALPMAIILVSATRLLFGGKKHYMSKLGLFLMTILLVAFTVSSVANYISWQARWVKDRSVMVNLAELENAEGISVFRIDDQYQLPAGVGDYLFYEWPRMFKCVWGDESRIGLETLNITNFLDNYEEGWGKYSERMHLSDFDPAGCQAILAIRPGPESTGSIRKASIRLSFLYFYYKFFSSEDRLTEFLHGVTNVTVQPISDPYAVNCPNK